MVSDERILSCNSNLQPSINHLVETLGCKPEAGGGCGGGGGIGKKVTQVAHSVRETGTCTVPFGMGLRRQAMHCVHCDRGSLSRVVRPPGEAPERRRVGVCCACGELLKPCKFTFRNNSAERNGGGDK